MATPTRVKAIIGERNNIELEYREEVNPFGDLLQAFGMLCNDEITVAAGNTDPSIAPGFGGNGGSVYFCGNENIYKKYGLLDTDWKIFSGGTGSIPSGGITNQVLMKISDADGDYDWRDEINDVDGGYYSG